MNQHATPATPATPSTPSTRATRAVFNTLALLGVLALLAASCSKPPPPREALARGEIPDALRAAFVQVELTPQSSEGEEPPYSLSDAMRLERPASLAGYLVETDLVITPDAGVPPRFVREWRARQGDDTVTARPVAWAADRRALLLKLEKPLPAARPLACVTPAENTTLAAHFSVEYSRAENWKTIIRPLSDTSWQISTNGERAHPVPPNSIIATAAGAPVTLAPGDTIPAGDAWKTPWRNWRWIYEDDGNARFEKLSAAAAPALIHVDIKLRPLPVRAGDNPYTQRAEDDPTSRPQPAIVLAPRRVLVLMPLAAAYTARLENVSLRLPGNQQVDARFIATLADYGAFIVEPERDIEAPLALPDAAPDWGALRDRLLLTIDLRLQGEARLARPGFTRITAADPGWRGVLTPRVADQGNSLFLFDIDGNLLGVPLVPRTVDTPDNRFGFRTSQSPRTVTVPASILATFTGDPARGKWADPSNIPVSEADERQLVWLGVDLQSLTRELAQAQGVSEQTQNGSNGGLVTKVYPDSPASRAGLQTGDVLLRMRREDSAQIIPIRARDSSASAMMMLSRPDQQIPDSMYDRIPPPWPVADSPLNQKLKEIGAGKVFEIDYARDGVFATIKFTAEKGPPYYATADEATFAGSGLNIKSLTFETRAFYKIPDEKSALIVSRVVAGSRASVAGLRPYDLIIEVNDHPVTTPAAFAGQAKAGGKLRLLTRRMSQTRIVTLDITAGE